MKHTHTQKLKLTHCVNTASRSSADLMHRPGVPKPNAPRPRLLASLATVPSFLIIKTKIKRMTLARLFH